MKKSIIKNLKLNLFLVPSIVILMSFIVIFLTFNIVINRYIERTVSKQLSEEFEVFDLQKSTLPYQDSMEEEDFIVNIYYLVLDENNDLLYPKEEWVSDKEKNRTYSISQYLKKNPLNIDSKESIIAQFGANTYYLKTKTYEGSYFYDEEDSSKKHTIVIYANISQTQNFLNVLNIILIILMLFFGIISILVIFQMARKIDTSFNKLKSYIIQVGKRETITALDTLAYKEFNDVAKTVRNMSDMIDKAENSQKQFFQNASHELRTPLMSIQGYAEGIKSGVIKDDKAIDIIIKESERMTSLVDEILFLSKMEIENKDINKDILDIKELLYYCSWSVKGSADKKNITIEHEFLSEYVEVNADESRLERAFLNILSNAIRYAKEKITLHCTLEHDFIVIKITDDGKGIEEKDLPHIFERFYKGVGGNFGIGLSITKDIINQHDGDISVISSEKGTSFIIKLPKYKDEI